MASTGFGTPFEDFRSPRIVQSLVQTCQRVLSVNIDSITSFGTNIPHRLIRPVLQGCNADTLLRLERETPHLKERTSELWKDICSRKFPGHVYQLLNSGGEEPESWRDEFFSKSESEAKRFQEAANRVRNQRIEAEELKRRRQAKVTDRLPPPKRSRTNNLGLPKTLIEKTRRDATKIQKSYFGRVLPPAASGNSKGLRPKVDVPGAKFSQKDSSSVLRSAGTAHSPRAACSLVPKSTRKADFAPN